MKAVLKNQAIAESDDIVMHDGDHYFPRSAVREGWLAKAPQTESDRACPHGVQFYDAVIDGRRFERTAWSYEAPLKAMQHVGHRVLGRLLEDNLRRGLVLSRGSIAGFLSEPATLALLLAAALVLGAAVLPRVKRRRSELLADANAN